MPDPNGFVWKSATANVLPSWRVKLLCIVPTVTLEHVRLTVNPPIGALAGFPLESWSCTIIAGYALPSEGIVGGKAETASVEGMGPIVLRVVCTVE